MFWSELLKILYCIDGLFFVFANVKMKGPKKSLNIIGNLIKKVLDVKQYLYLSKYAISLTNN